MQTPEAMSCKKATEPRKCEHRVFRNMNIGVALLRERGA